MPSRRSVAVALGLGLAASVLVSTPVPAHAVSTGLVITEVYGAGGNSGANLNADYVELRNVSTAPISLNGKSLQYRSSGGVAGANGVAILSGTVPPGEHFLVQTSPEGDPDGSELGPSDLVVTGVNMSGTAGTVWLANTQSNMTLPTGSVVNAANVIDLVGFGGTNTSEVAPTGVLSSTTSAKRTNENVDGDNNGADFTVGAQTPAACSACEEEPPADGDYTIAEIQGDGAQSELVGAQATTRGIVTATYPTGGLNGIYIQTAGTGGATDATPGASDAVFVFGANSRATDLQLGDYVEVVGEVAEFAGTTELVPAAGGVELLTGTPAPVTPLVTGLPATEADKEAHEGELLAPTGPFTVTNTFPTNQFAEIGLAAQATPLIQPTEVEDAQGIEDDALAAQNAQRAVTLDDGASLNFLSPTNQDTPLPWLTATRSIRVGAAAQIVSPVILEFRNNAWKFQPRQQVTGTGTDVATFEDTRPVNLAPQEVGGELTIGTFNVLNYFNTTGRDYRRDGGQCTFFADRELNPVAVDSCGTPTASDGNGPRGAAQADDLTAQQAKIVEAINTMDTDVVSLEEIENSVKLLSAEDKGDRDNAVKALVAALNADAQGGQPRWAHVASPSASELPTLAEQDVIRNAFIYNPQTVEPVGRSRVLVGVSAFNNAREPLAQAFKKVGDTNADAFGVIVNHFKSKGSGVDDGTGQGNANPDRVNQAKALADFADQFQASRDLSTVFLTGDFNSYSKEDPMQVLDDAGWTLLKSDFGTEHSYSFAGRTGSLDHVLVNDAAQPSVTGVDVWDVNAGESVAYQYSRRNYNVTQFFNAADPFAASDHNPEVVGFDVLPDAEQNTTVQVLGTNDFHGRIANDPGSSAAGAAVMAGAVDQLREQNPNTVFAAAGDLIGASTFESFIANDKPTIDALNAAGLEVSAAGNHEFDQGYGDLVNRVMAPYDAQTNPEGGAAWDYIAANVRKKIDDSHALAPTWTQTFGDVEVGFVGAVTEDLPTLVNPDGITDIKVTPIVQEVNAATADLKADGADLVVMLVHEGASSTSLADAIDPNQTFGKIVNGVSEDVDAIVSGHTHLAYNHAVPVQAWVNEGRDVTTRPVVSAGQYGAALNRLRFTVDDSGDVVKVTQRILNLKSGQTPLYDADAQVAEIVRKAVAEAEVLGAVKVGDLAGGFYRAKLSDGTTENRGGESTLGNLVAEVQRARTPETVLPTGDTDGADIAFMNPGGLRADLLGSGTGAFPRDLTYKQAATVQPFANTLVNMDLTGAQIKNALEQQWQPGASRPFLKLGASEGFTYTYDPDAAQGSRITGMWLDGTALDSSTTYQVTVNSFLASGGDGFGALAGGTNKQDTGVTDLQAMVDYLEEDVDGALPVDHSQRAVGVNYPAGAPATYPAGSDVELALSSLSMTGPGDINDTEVAISLDGEQLGTAPVTTTRQSALPGFDEAGTALVDVTIPSDLSTGDYDLLVRGATTGTEALVPISVENTEPEPGAESTTTATATPAQVKVSKHTSDIDVTVSSEGATPATGEVVVLDGEREFRGTLTAGHATVTVGPFDTVGPRTLVVRYLGDEVTAPSETTVDVEVLQRNPIITVERSPRRVVADETRALLTVTVSAGEGVTATGPVEVRRGGEVLDAGRLDEAGTVRLRLPVFIRAGERTVRVVYGGDDNVLAENLEYTFTVHNR